MANVNSVKFSPDGQWIASAGTEGSVIIWDIRMSRQFIEFPEHASPVTCVQFHPYELLLGAGRNDGTVDLYDLESKQMIARATDNSFSGHTVKCITFSEKGDCLFVGSTVGVSVIGWEPDRDLGHVEATWNMLGDMKIKGSQLICGAYEASKAAIYMTPIEEIFRPVSVQSSSKPFEPQHPVRRSFNRGNGKLKLSIGNKASSPPQYPPIQQEDGLSSPNLSIEMIDEDGENSPDFSNDITYIQLPPKSIETNNHDYAFIPKSMSSSSSHNMVDIDEINGHDETMTSYFPEDALMLGNSDIQPEKEDFPINNAQPPEYTTKPLKQVSRSKAQQMVRQPSNMESRNKLSGSVSTMELNKISDDQPNYSASRKPMCRGTSPVRNIRSIKKTENNTLLNRENIKNKNITVHIMTKPLRSKSSLDMKMLSGIQPTQIPKIIQYNPDQHTFSSDEHELQLINSCHDSVHQALCNRNTSLKILLSTTKGKDIVTMLRKAIQISDRGVLIDVIGALLEKTAAWSLDMCVILLPELYELLQGDYKFHAMRACDTLREILSKFLPVIKENSYQWGSTIGVDLTREERYNKCCECRKWLLRIKQLPENKTIGSSLAQIQNMIVDI